MKKNRLIAISAVVFGLMLSTFVFAQDDKTVSAAGETYVISAKAGGVNFVEGKVSIIRKAGKSGFLLKTDKVEIGDKISTGADGKVEILLNPGSFVRLGANAEFEFVTTDLENLQLKLSAGSAIFEVYADDEFKVTLDLPKADIELTKSGVFRVDVLSDGSGKISVWKGKVYVGDEKAEVKSGKSAIVSGKTASIAKFDRDNKDDFDTWSQFRAKESAKINARLQRDALRNSLLGSFNRGGWDRFGSFGLWVYDAFTGRWCFLPFGSRWSSPYGFSYGFDFDYCQLPPYVYTQQPQIPPTTMPTTPTTPTTPTSAQIREERRQNMHTPTFQRFENNTRGGGGGSVDSQNNGGNTQGDNNSEDRSRSKNDSDNNRSRSKNDSDNTTRTKSDDNWTPTYSPSPSNPAPSNPTPSTPIIDIPSRTETKSVKDN